MGLNPLSRDILRAMSVVRAKCCKLMRKKIKKSVSKAPKLAQRLKKMPTMISKLSRMDGSLDSMQDIAGIRIVFRSNNDLRKFEKTLKQSTRFDHKLKNIKDYISEPKKDGYRGVHLVYRSNSIAKDVPEEFKGLMIEIQLRTQPQHYWATAVEAVDMIYKQTLKFGSGEAKWERFFLLVSAAIALDEKLLPPKEFEGKSRLEIIAELARLEKEFKAEQKLAAMSGLTDQLAKKERNSSTIKFYLLMLNTDRITGARRFQYWDFAEEDETTANIWYKALEQGKEDGKSNLDVVLVRTTGRQLALLYSNYFLDVSQFLIILKKLLST